MEKLQTHSDVMEAIADSIDIPEHLDKLARDRYRSIGEWLDRDTSTLRHLDPEISPQGSFLLGTVTKPVGDRDDYDIDLVCKIDGSKLDMTMEELKRCVGVEIVAYCRAHGMKHEPEDKRRCWTLEYADKANFHMDILPALPEPPGTAIAITDKEHPHYGRVCEDWPETAPAFAAAQAAQAEAASIARSGADTQPWLVKK